MRMAGATDSAVRGDERETLLRRIGLAASKYWVCKRATPHAAEAMECLGGNGYVEESGMPRLLRDAPLNSIWEGSGNVAALDVLRAMFKEPEGLPAFMAECELGRGGNALLDAHLDKLATAAPPTEGDARRVVEDLAVALQASLLLQHAPAAVADAYCASRLGRDEGHAYGTLPSTTDFEGIVERAWRQ